MKSLQEINGFVRKFLQAPDKHKIDVIEEVLDALHQEAEKMGAITHRLTTNVSDRAAFCAVLNEMDNRWRIFAKRTNTALNLEEIKPNGFAKLWERKNPELFREWMQIRVEIGMPPL